MTKTAIIADSSPLIGLALIGQLNLLPRLYPAVFVPPAVWDEVTQQGAGLPGALEVSQCDWLQIQAPELAYLEPLRILIDRGEAEALALAQSMPDSIVLLDDAQARRVAERFNITRIGTLGVLRRAKKAGWLNEIKPLVIQLQENGIYIRQTLIDAVLQDVGEA